MPSAREAHVNDCLDAQGCPLDASPEETEVNCSVCDRNLVSLSANAREVHVNRCLDKTLPSTTNSRRHRREAPMNASTRLASRSARTAAKKSTGPALCAKMKTLLEMVGLERYEKRFAAQEVDIVALQLLEDGDWAELGLPEGARRRITDAARHAKLMEMRATAITNDAPSEAIENAHVFDIANDDGDDDVDDDNDVSAPNAMPATQHFRTSNLGSTMARRKGHLLAGMAGRLHCDDDDETEEEKEEEEGLKAESDHSDKEALEISTGIQVEATKGRVVPKTLNSHSGANTDQTKKKVAPRLRASRGYTQLESFLDEVDANEGEGDDTAAEGLPVEVSEAPAAPCIQGCSANKGSGHLAMASAQRGTSSAFVVNSLKDGGGGFGRVGVPATSPAVIDIIEISPEAAAPALSPPENRVSPLPQPDLELPSDTLPTDGVVNFSHQPATGFRSEEYAGVPQSEVVERARRVSVVRDARSPGAKSKGQFLALDTTQREGDEAVVCSVGGSSLRQDDDEGLWCQDGALSEHSDDSGVLDLAGSDNHFVSPSKPHDSAPTHPVLRSTCDGRSGRDSRDPAVLDLAGCDRSPVAPDRVVPFGDANVGPRSSEQCPYDTEAEVNQWFNERRNDEIRRHRGILERLEAERQRACESAIDYRGEKSSSPGLLGKRKGAAGSAFASARGTADAADDRELSAGESDDSVLDLTQRGGEVSEGDENTARDGNVADVTARVGAASAAAAPKRKSKKNKKASAPRPPPARDEELVSVIRGNHELHDKILVVEPVALDAVMAAVKQAGFRVSVANLAAFLDRQGVNYKVGAKEQTDGQREYMKQLNSQL